MATLASLTPTQQAQLSVYAGIFRPAMGQIARSFNALAQMDLVWQTTILPTVTSLDPGTEIPDQTNLAGAAPLMREDYLSMMVAIEAVLTTYNTTPNRAEYIKIAGLTNTTGG